MNKAFITAIVVYLIFGLGFLIAVSPIFWAVNKIDIRKFCKGWHVAKNPVRKAKGGG